jgi:putative aldouronate transport system substrate-binding protein
MDQRLDSVARARHAFFKRRTLMKWAGAAAGAGVVGGHAQGALAAQEASPEASPDSPAALSDGGTVPESPGYDLPIAEPGTVTYKFATTDNGYAPRSYTQNLEIWAEIEKRTGITIEWEVVPGAQYEDVMSVRLGAGRDLPDIIRLTSGIDPVSAGSNGIAMPLNDLIEQHAPNIKAFLDEFPDIRALMTAPDGEIYALPSVVTDAAFADPLGILIRQDWLDQLGLKEPKTLDDWYHVLKAFKTDILEANGVTDVAPMLGGSGGADGTIFQFGNALGLHFHYSRGWSVDDAGAVHYEWIDDRMKELIAWFSTLYAERLLDPRYHETSKEDRIQLVTSNNVGVDADFINRAVEWNKIQAQSGVADANWVIALPPTSDRIDTPYYELYGPLSGWFSLSANVAQPEIAIRWLDYIWASDEGNTLVSYGLEDVTYTADDDGKLHFTEWVTANPDGLDPNSALRYYGALPTTPWIRANRGPLSEMAWDVTRIDPGAVANAEKVGPYLVSAFPNVLPTAEESEEIAGILVDLDTFRTESILKFVLGQESIEESWETYVSTINSLGLERLIEIKQQQYDRYKDLQ